MKLSQIVVLRNEVDALFASHKMNLTTKYKLNKFRQTLVVHTKPFDESRDALIKELGEQAEDGSITLQKEQAHKFNEQINALLDEEIDFTPDKIPFSLIESIEGGAEGNYPELFSIIE